MTVVAAYPFLEVKRIAAFDQHVLTIIGFKENGITLAEILYDIGAAKADVGEYADCDLLARYHKTVRVDGIM